MGYLKCNKMHVQHTLSETDLSNQVKKMSKPKAHVPLNKNDLLQ